MFFLLQSDIKKILSQTFQGDVISIQQFSSTQCEGTATSKQSIKCPPETS